MSKKIVDSIPSPGIDEPETVNVEVREIENGFVKRTSVYGGEEGYRSSEVFSPERPRVMAQDAKEPSSRGNSLKMAVGMLKRR